MAFNLGAFAGGLVSGGLKTYTTLKEQERLEGIEARDKERFAEEQRQIELRREAEALQRKAAIPDAADQPGINVDRIVEALPQAALYAGNEKGVVGFSQAEVNANEQAFRSAIKGLTPEQQALVFRGYGDQSNAGGQAFEKSQRLGSNNKEGIPTGLNAAVVREDAGGGRSVVTADTDEKKTVARYKAMAMASGNPVAIKAANEAEIAMLNRQVAEQSLKVGDQNIELNVMKLSEAKDLATFKTKFNTQLEAVTKENNDLLLSINKDSVDSNVTLESLVKKYGGKIKDAGGGNLLVENGVVYTKDAGGNKVVLANSKEQAIDLLKTNAGLYFAQNLSNRLVSNGLFKDADAFNTFYAAERKYVMDAAGLANSRVMAAAATSNAASAAVSAGASVTSAQAAASRAKADTDLVAAQLAAGGPKAEADYKKAQAIQAKAQANYYGALKTAADDERTTGQAATRAMKPFLEAYAKLSREDQLSDKGQALLDQAAAASITDAKGASQVLTALRGSEAKPITPDALAKFKESFAGDPSSFKDPTTGEAILIGKLNPAQVMQEMQAMIGGKSPTGSGLSSGAPPPKEGPPKVADAAAKPAAIPVAPIAGSPAAIEVARRQAAADAKEQATKTLKDTATAAATAAISASSQVDARKVQQMDGFNLLPVDVQAKISKIVNKPVSAIPAAKSAGPSAAELAAAAEDALVEKTNAELAKSKAAPAAPAEKSVKAREEDLSYKVIVAQSTYDRRPGATTKAQLASAQQELANFRKANGIK